MPAEQFIEDIRIFEADHGLKPSDIQILSTGEITVTIDKSVLYQYQPGQKSTLQRFWSWLNDSDNSFNPDSHAAKMAEKINQNANDGSQVRVSVRKRYKQLPIPYFSIPIPIENAGTKVRDHSNLAVQKIKVSLTFPPGYSTQAAIKKLAKAAVMSDTLEGTPSLPDAARRASWNPIKWGLHMLSKLVPRRLAQKFNKILPNKWIKATRPYEWGTNFCEQQINHGFINSGLAASTLNLAVIGPLTSYVGSLGDLGRGGHFVCGSQEILYDRVDEYNDDFNFRCYTKLKSVDADRFTLFAQTRAKLAPRHSGYDYEDEVPTTEAEIDRAIERTFSFA